MTNTSELENFSKQVESGAIPKTNETIIVKDGELVKEEPVATAPETETPKSAPVSSLLDDDDDEVVIVGVDQNAAANAGEISSEKSMLDNFSEILTRNLSGISERNKDDFDQQKDQMIEDIVKYHKNLIINGGLTAEEALIAAKNRLERKSTEANAEYLKNNPDLAIVKVDKTKADKVEFSEEEKAKISKAKSIRLVEVEDSTLLTIPIKESPEENILFNAIHRVSCNVAKYSLPMINTYDHCEFSGATTIQLVQAVYDENDSDYRRYQEQLELVYSKFQGSTTMDKYDAEGNVILTKDDFAKWFRFYDLPVAMYCIYVASSTEEITGNFTCESCGKEYEVTYNTKKLISYPDISNKFQEDLNNILANESDRDALSSLKEKNRKGKRFKSQFTGNIYDITSPSVARALNVFRYVNPRDQYAKYLALYAILIEAIYVYDKNDQQYYKINADNPRSILQFLYDITDTELKLISKIIDDFYYVPTFSLTTVCSECGHVHNNTFRIDELVFRKVQDMEAEIE